jgi:hypothetical protein
VRCFHESTTGASMNSAFRVEVDFAAYVARLDVSGGQCYVTSFAALQGGEPWATYILASKPLR